VTSPQNALVSLDSINTALKQVGDSGLPLEVRGHLYAKLRVLKLRLERALRPITNELTEAMVREGAKEYGPLWLTWRAIDVRWPVNDPGNWEDDGVREYLEAKRADPASRPFIRAVPAHLEVDTAALGEAVHTGDPAAQAFHRELKDRGLRTEQGKTASLSVRENAA
jgi:hypothetical protein